eukprot:77374-Prorocentrum_minimum.AAC.4
MCTSATQPSGSEKFTYVLVTADDHARHGATSATTPGSERGVLRLPAAVFPAAGAPPDNDQIYANRNSV